MSTKEERKKNKRDRRDDKVQSRSNKFQQEPNRVQQYSDGPSVIVNSNRSYDKMILIIFDEDIIDIVELLTLLKNNDIDHKSFTEDENLSDLIKIIEVKSKIYDDVLRKISIIKDFTFTFSHKDFIPENNNNNNIYNTLIRSKEV